MITEANGPAQGAPARRQILAGQDSLHAELAEELCLCVGPHVTVPDSAAIKWPDDQGHVRGIGLVCSAYGNVVENASNVTPFPVRKWSQGSWDQHMLPLADYLVRLAPCTSEPTYQQFIHEVNTSGMCWLSHITKQGLTDM